MACYLGPLLIHFICPSKEFIVDFTGGLSEVSPNIVGGNDFKPHLALSVQKLHLGASQRWGWA